MEITAKDEFLWHEYQDHYHTDRKQSEEWLNENRDRLIVIGYRHIQTRIDSIYEAFEDNGFVIGPFKGEKRWFDYVAKTPKSIDYCRTLLDMISALIPEEKGRK